MDDIDYVFSYFNLLFIKKIIKIQLQLLFIFLSQKLNFNITSAISIKNKWFYIIIN